MNALENLVPPLELCKQIPEEKFEDSVFVWAGAIPTIRPNFRYKEMYPAPTLAEIMRACDDLDEGYLPTCCFTGVKWRMESRSNPFLASIKRHRTSDKNPATAALKLWLELNKEQ